MGGGVILCGTICQDSSFGNFNTQIYSLVIDLLFSTDFDPNKVAFFSTHFYHHVAHVALL